MTLDREALWKWLGSAPLPVVLSICLGTSGVLGRWVWAVAAEVSDQKATVAVAAEQAEAARDAARAVEARLVRLEEKLDRLLEAVAGIRPSLPPPPPPRKEKNP